VETDADIIVRLNESEQRRGWHHAKSRLVLPQYVIYRREFIV